MLSKEFNGVTVVFDAGEGDTAELIGGAAEDALRLIRELWGLEKPEDCRIFVMTSWWGFFFQSAPWPWRIVLAITFPFWSFRARRMWPYSAAWTQRFGRRIVIGVKPPRLLETADKSIGVHMFVEEKDMEVKIRHLVCHELTHACSAHLGLPAWLNEGLAAVTVDRYLGKQTIRTDSLDLVRSFTPKGSPPDYRTLSRMHGKAIAYHAVRGYWLVRFLEAKRPGFLRRLLSSARWEGSMETGIAAELGMEPADLWGKIDEMMAAHFEK